MDPDLKRSLKKMGVLTLVLMVGIITLGLLFASELQAFSHVVVETLGYTGIGVGIFIADALTFPVPPDFYLAVAVTAGLDPVKVIIVGSICSIMGGISGFAIGRWLGTVSFTQKLVEPFREEGTRLINKLGVTAVIVAALTPIPFSITCVLAGMMGMTWKVFLPATLFRIPRIAGYYLLIQLGWMVAT